MALDDNDRREIASLIRTELGKVLQEVAKGGGVSAASGLDIKSVGSSLEAAALAQAGRRMIPSDNCCNGCD